MFKRVLSMLLVLVTLATFVPFYTFAAEEDTKSAYIGATSERNVLDGGADQLEEYRMYDGVRKTVYIAGDGRNSVGIFTPEYSDTYEFTSYATGDTVGAIYDETGTTQLAYNDDYNGNRNFQISYYMTAGVTYVLTSRYYSSYTSGSYDIMISGTHSHDFSEGSCTVPETCAICGLTQGEASGHTYDDDCDVACNACDEVRTPPHSWDHACDTDCNLCGTTRLITHDFITVGCLQETVCRICNTPSGIIPGHIYDNACDNACNICNQTRKVTHKWKAATCKTPATCALCKATTGKALGHTFTNVCDTTCDRCKGVRTAPHSYKTVVKKATVSANGYIAKQCALCKVVASKKAVYKVSKVTISATKFTYNGKVQRPKVVVKDSQGKNLSSAYYTVTYSSGSKNAGTYKVVVKLKGYYSGSKVFTYKINPAPASKVTVKQNKTAFAYNAKVQTPTLTLKDANGNTLKNKRDYTIQYPSGRKNVGTYKIVITFKGNYSGKKTVTYTISPTIKTSLTGYIGDTIKIGAKSNAKITYTSSNKKIATVDSKGVIKAVKAGTVTITVKSGKVSQKIKLKIATPTIKLKPAATSMYIGTSQKITATTTPKGKVTWSVNNKKLAKISSSGKLTALGKGTVTVTGKFTYKGKTYKSSCKVTIDVEYPDISVFISSQISYSNSYAFVIDNESSRPLKVINRGWVYCGGDSADVQELFSDSFCKSFTVPAGSSKAGVLCLDEKMVFLKSKTTYAYIYIEYGGETFMLSCNTSKYGLNKCSTITWMKKS